MQPDPDFKQFDDGFGIMQDTQIAKPQSSRAGGGWFAFNLATNQAQMWSESPGLEEK